GQHIEAELMVRQGQEGLGFGAKRAMVARAVGVGTAADAQGEAQDGIEGGDRAVLTGGDPKPMAALRAMSGHRGEGLGLRRSRPATGARHGSRSSCASLPLFYRCSRPKFATLEKNGDEFGSRLVPKQA